MLFIVLSNSGAFSRASDTPRAPETLLKVSTGLVVKKPKISGEENAFSERREQWSSEYVNEGEDVLSVPVELDGRLSNGK